MNIGVLYSKPFENMLVMSFLLQAGQDNLTDTPWIPGTLIEDFEIAYKENVYCFSPNIASLNHCDRKILLVSVFDSKRIKIYKDVVETILCFSMDESVSNIESEINEMLKIPHCFYISHMNLTDKIENKEKVIVDQALTFYYFYYVLGYQLINFYPKEEKEHLFGVYNMHTGYKTERSKLIEFFELNLKHPVHIYPKGDVLGHKKNFLDSISWQRATQHSTTYQDYSLSVANLIFESNAATGLENLLFTEKTLKAILFQKANIFFIYLGGPDQLDWLHSNGFWFLNSDFYKDPTLIDRLVEERLDIHTHFGHSTVPSAVHAMEYLVYLKNKLGSDTDVYNYLLDLHQDKINTNIELFKRLLTCSYIEKFENLIGVR